MLMLMMIILTVRWWWTTITDGGGWLTFRKEKGNDVFGWSPASLQDVDDVMMIMIERKIIVATLNMRSIRWYFDFRDDDGNVLVVLGSQNPLGNGSKGVVANPPLSFSKTLSCPPQSPCWPSHPDAVHSPQIF